MFIEQLVLTTPKTHRIVSCEAAKRSVRRQRRAQKFLKRGHAWVLPLLLWHCVVPPQETQDIKTDSTPILWLKNQLPPIAGFFVPKWGYFDLLCILERSIIG